jgi:polyisoprenoid-binding protein YceI
MKKVGVALAVVVALFVGGPWAYINLIREDAPDELSLPSATTAVDTSSTVAAPEAPADPTGSWVAGAGSLAGYRVEEILFGQRVTAVGRTSDVTGEVAIEAGAVTSASFTVDMSTVASDEGKRDNQFRTRIMDVLNHPTATFVLTEPIVLPSGAIAGLEDAAVAATGDLTLRGVTKPVVLDVTARLAGGSMEISASTEIVFAEWGIPDPSLPGISTEDRGVLEVLLVMVRP